MTSEWNLEVIALYWISLQRQKTMQGQLASAANAFSKRRCRLKPPVSPELALIHFPLRRLNPSHLATWKANRVADSLAGTNNGWWVARGEWEESWGGSRGAIALQSGSLCMRGGAGSGFSMLLLVVLGALNCACTHHVLYYPIRTNEMNDFKTSVKYIRLCLAKHIRLDVEKSCICWILGQQRKICLGLQFFLLKA